MSQVWARDRVKKRHLHAHQTVSFMYNPEGSVGVMCYNANQ